MPRLALAAIVLVMACLSIFALWQTMSATEQVDRERAAVAINAMLRNHVQRLEVYTAEQAYSDELAQELYGSAHSELSISEQWLETSLSDEHDLAFAYDSSGQQLIAIESGEITVADYRRQYSSAIAKLTSRITDTSDCVGGIAWSPTGPRFLTVARVRPVTSGSFDAAVQSRPAYIALSKPVSPELLSHIGQLLGIDGIKVGLDNDSHSASLTEVTQQVGNRSMAVSWTPAQPGKQALKRSLPPILFVLCGGVVLVALLSHLIGRLLSAALRDTLSHLPNRRALEMRIARNAARDRPQMLALIDLDGFKRVNDSYGSRIGDKAIKAISEILMSVAPEDATVARLGGDEFAVLSVGNDGGAGLMRAMQAFHAALQAPLSVENIQLQLSATSGIADTANGSSGVAKDLLIQCDRALSVAKKRHRGSILAYDTALADEFETKAALAVQIESALDQNLLDMHFQPLLEIANGRITAVEALMRWRPEANILAGPEQVIEAAESHGLGMKLARAVLRDACGRGRDWLGVRIAVNVTPSQFLDPELPNHIASIMREFCINADRMELEVTESIAIADEAVFSQQFSRLHAMGIHLALDDFGSGYASIGFLRRFPFQKLKIDKSLVDDSLARPQCREMLVACVSAARALGIKTVAEGIETDGHRTLASVAGCDFLQGYHIGKPMPAAKFSEILMRQDQQAPRRSA